MKNIDDEVQFHIDEAVDTLVGQGWTPEAARTEAERRFGNTRRYRRRLTVMTRAGAIRGPATRGCSSETRAKTRATATGLYAGAKARKEIYGLNSCQPRGTSK